MLMWPIVRMLQQREKVGECRGIFRISENTVWFVVVVVVVGRSRTGSALM
jgi:hypothetical protein